METPHGVRRLWGDYFGHQSDVRGMEQRLADGFDDDPETIIGRVKN